MDAIIRALLEEREGYVLRGMSDRVAQVDEQLARHGYAPTPDKRAERVRKQRAVKPQGEKRG